MTEDPNVDTRFELDDRQRAMLAEMGVRVWLPKTPLRQSAETLLGRPAAIPGNHYASGRLGQKRLALP